MKLYEELSSLSFDATFANPRIEKLLQREVLKKFDMSGLNSWVSWQTFGTHKNVYYWFLIEGGYAVGHNESPTRGWGFPVKKLSDEQVKTFLNYKEIYDTK